MARKCAFILILALAGLSRAASQSLPVVAAYSLSSDNANDTLSRTVNDLVFSFIRELRTYRMVDMRSESLPVDLRVPDGTDYLFYGSLKEQPDGIRLELVLKGGPDSVTRMISRVYENSNRILLESRMLVRTLFDQSVPLPDPSANQEAAPPSGGTEQQEVPSDALMPVRNTDSLAGSWRGEEGLEKIMLLRGGRGVAVLSSGISISLDLVIVGDDLVIRQKGSINPRQFSDLPDSVARQASAIVPPLEWRFRVSVDQKKLSGTKKTVTIRHDGQNILSMDPVTVDVSWNRD
jgi:hypothetical protein